FKLSDARPPVGPDAVGLAEPQDAPAAELCDRVFAEAAADDRALRLTAALGGVAAAAFVPPVRDRLNGRRAARRSATPSKRAGTHSANGRSPAHVSRRPSRPRRGTQLHALLRPRPRPGARDPVPRRAGGGD